jgi:RHS repeat-associated protein
VTDHTGREARYVYEGNLLVKAVHPSGAEYRYSYDSRGNLCSLTGPLGIETIANEYDGHGRLVRQSFADGGIYSLSYDDKITTATEQNGNRVRYVRDDMYRTVLASYSNGDERYGYDERSKRTGHTDRNGNVRKYVYDIPGNLTKAVDPLGNETTLEYDAYGKPTKIVNPMGGAITNEYDCNGNITSAANPLGHAVMLENDKRGLVTKVTLPDGSENRIAYDDRGNVLGITDSGGSETRYEYDKLNRVTKTTDGNGNVTGYGYNTNGDITKVTNAEGYERTYEYNANGRLTKLTDFGGGVTEYRYSPMGRVEEVLDPSGGVLRLEYDLMWNVSKQTDANGNATVFEFDAMNRLEKVTNAGGVQISYEYDANGNMTKARDARGGETRFSYDALDRVKTVTEPDGSESGVEYDCMGRVTRLVDPMGNETRFGYDVAGQKVLESGPAGMELKYTYTALGQISGVTDSAGRAVKYGYLPGGLLESVKYPDGRVVKYAYDANRNVISKETQDGYTLNYEYDCLNRITRIYSSEGQEKFYTYDAVGNVTSITDANGNTTGYTYSPGGSLTSVTDPIGNVSEYGYDRLGNLTEIRQFAELDEARRINGQNPKPHVTRYEWNELNQVKRVTDALGNAESYTYDDAGNLVGKLDRDGFLTKYAYTSANLLEGIMYADGNSVKLSYNPLRHLTEIHDRLGVTMIESDALGRAKKVTDHNGNEVGYAYGAGGGRTSITYPDGKAVQYRYDEALRLKTLIDGDNRIDYAYDENSRLSGRSFPNGISTKYTYNEVGLLSGLAHSDMDGILDRYTYTYDNMGNKTGIGKYRRSLDEESGRYDYSYDALSRLTGVSKDGIQTKTFGYDASGNRSHMTDNSGRTSYQYNALNQLISTADTAGMEQSFSYDRRGNLKQILENGTIKNSYEFSPLNRLTKATNADGQSSIYDYNGLGFRVGKQITDGINPTKHISYVLDLTKQYHNMLQVGDGADSQSYAWDGNVAFADGNAYLHDELGSPLRYVDSTGNIIDSYGYDEFGCDLYGNQGTTQPFGYTGYTSDTIAGTYFAQAREYMPGAGRFIANDIHWHTGNMIYGDVIRQVQNASLLPNLPTIRQSSNLYNYGLSNPIKYVDPLGKDVWLVHGTTGITSQDEPDAGLEHWQTGEDGMDFINFLVNELNQTIRYDFTWAGGNSTGDRAAAAADLAAQIREAHLVNPCEPIRIVGYSHGSNVAIDAINILSQQGVHVETLIKIAGPNRIVYGLDRNASVGQVINVYNNWDGVQSIGGIDTPWLAHNFWEGAWDTVTLNPLLRYSSRRRMRVDNIRVTTGVRRWRFWHWFGYNHKFMHNNIAIWEKYILPALNLSEVPNENNC